MKAVGRASVGAVALIALAACDLPFALGQPTIRALNSGAGDSLDAARSFRISGSYTESSISWTIDLELARPNTDHGSYFRGRQFLASNLGSDPASQSLLQAAGDAWWTGLAAQGPVFPDFTKGAGFRATFLGTAVTSRTDHVSVGGVPAVELSGPRANVYLGEAPPYRVLRVHMYPGAVDRK